MLLGWYFGGGVRGGERGADGDNCIAVALVVHSPGSTFPRTQQANYLLLVVEVVVEVLT